MDKREAELVQDVVVQVRATPPAAPPAWRRALVRFEMQDGCFSTRVSHGADVTHGALLPLDAVRHRHLFVGLQSMGRQLLGPARDSGGACEVEIDPLGHRTHRPALRASGRQGPGRQSDEVSDCNWVSSVTSRVRSGGSPG